MLVWYGHTMDQQRLHVLQSGSIIVLVCVNRFLHKRVDLEERVFSKPGVLLLVIFSLKVSVVFEYVLICFCYSTGVKFVLSAYIHKEHGVYCCSYTDTCMIDIDQFRRAYSG